MSDFRELPVHPDAAGMDQWQSWAAHASPAQVFEAFVARFSLSKIAVPDLEPVPALLASTLREKLQGGPA